MASTKTIADRFKERETWILILGNVVGLALATGVIDVAQAELFNAKGGESIGLLFALITNVGMLASRGIAKIGTGN